MYQPCLADGSAKIEMKLNRRFVDDCSVDRLDLRLHGHFQGWRAWFQVFGGFEGQLTLFWCGPLETPRTRQRGSCPDLGRKQPRTPPKRMAGIFIRAKVGRANTGFIDINYLGVHPLLTIMKKGW